MTYGNGSHAVGNHSERFQKYELSHYIGENVKIAHLPRCCARIRIFASGCGLDVQKNDKLIAFQLFLKTIGKCPGLGE
jgi:hypothetical protein